MKPVVKTEDGFFETYYGDVRMPHYAGVGGNVHQVTQDWKVGGVLDDGRVFFVTVRVGFRFDGCSVPRALWWLCGDPFEVPRIAAALAHDWLYAAHVCDRKLADEIFRNVCKQAGVNIVSRAVEHANLRLFGLPAWKSHGEEDNVFARAHGALSIEGEQQTGENAK